MTLELETSLGVAGEASSSLARRVDIIQIMPTTKYLGHEINTYVRDHGQETAHAIVDGKPMCFLNGLAEAKRFIREAKAGEHYGPKPASWQITLENSGCVAMYGRESVARSDAAYYLADGRTIELSMCELCAYPGCDGHGTVGESARGRRTERPCPRHAAPITTVLETGDVS